MSSSDFPQLECLYKTLFRRMAMKKSSTLLVLCTKGIHQRLEDSPHKGPLIRKAFSCHDLMIPSPRWTTWPRFPLSDRANLPSICPPRVYKSPGSKRPRTQWSACTRPSGSPTYPGWWWRMRKLWHAQCARARSPQRGCQHRLTFPVPRYLSAS